MRAALGAALVLAGCTTTVTGTGHGSAPPSMPSNGPSNGPSAPGAPTATIGDPNTADLCAGVQLSAYRSLGTPIFEPAQIATSCYVTIMKGSVPAVELSVVAMPLDKAKPRQEGNATAVAGLPVVAFPGDQFTCQRDIWTADVVLSVTSDDIGASTSKAALCRGADQLVRQVATPTAAGNLPRRKLASPSLVTLDLCHGIDPGDLRTVSNGAWLAVAKHYYGTFCRATNDRYTLGAQVVFRKAAAKPGRTSTVTGHRFAWFDEISPDSIVCDVTSIQKATADPTIVEAVDFYLLAKNTGLRGPQLCNVLTAEAVRVLNRLTLS